MKAIDVRQKFYRKCTDGENEVNRFQTWKEILKFVKCTIFIQILGCDGIYNHSLALYQSSYRVITTVSSSLIHLPHRHLHCRGQLLSQPGTSLCGHGPRQLPSVGETSEGEKENDDVHYECPVGLVYSSLLY